MRFSWFCIFLAVSTAMSQPPDLDQWDDALDLTILRTPEPSPTPEAPVEAPPAHLFGGFVHAPEVPEPGEERFETVEASDLRLLTLPASEWLVVPNTARVDQAYRRLTDAREALDLKTAFPLKVLLHADGNVSAAVALAEKVDAPLPLGTDVSPRPVLRLVGIWADIQVARRDHPPTVAAFVELRRQAATAGLELDTSELVFLPSAPGRVFLAVRLKTAPHSE